jgi:hypothetical protein
MLTWEGVGAMAELSFDLLAASLRQDTHDLEAFHEVLAAKLQEALPTDAVRIRRGGLPFASRRPLAELEVVLGDESFVATHQAGHFSHRVAKVVRGIALKTAEMPFQDWLGQLTQALWSEAQESESTREALERFLN